MSLFGTNDIIYVQPGDPLIIEDVYQWRRIKIDVARLGLQIRTDAFEEISGRLRSALGIMEKSPKFHEDSSDLTVRVDRWIKDLVSFSSAGSGKDAASIQDIFRNNTAVWWVRLSDKPAESFHEDDYERDLHRVQDAQPYPTFGMVNVAALDDLDFQLTEDEESPLPFTIEVPSADAAARFTMPPTEPLPLVREFCGARGASAFGRTVNLGADGKVAEGHQFCTPFAKVSDGLFLTLYFYFGTDPQAKIVTKLKREELFDAIDLLERSRFDLVSEGPTWRIYQREGGDVIHLYDQLAGKEADGSETIPPLLLVASASGYYDPMHRAELLEAILATIRSHGSESIE